MIAKLFSWRGSDQRDIETPSVLSAINWQLLDYLATDGQEAQASALNDRCYQDFIENYHAYVRRCKPCSS